MLRFPTCFCTHNGTTSVSGLLILAIAFAGCGKQTATFEPRPVPEPELSVGDQAPAFRFSQLVLGDPVSEAEAQGVQVIEFWATWCGPCLKGMPHLSALQQEYGAEVTIVGVTEEPPATVATFLGSTSIEGTPWRDVIKYRLALDDRGATSAAYMKAAGQSGIPTAFIVGKDGVIDWIGHPAEMDEPLRAVVDGTWDRDAAREEFLLESRANAYEADLRKALSRGNWAEARIAIDSIESVTGKTETTAQMRQAVEEMAARGGS